MAELILSILLLTLPRVRARLVYLVMTLLQFCARMILLSLIFPRLTLLQVCARLDRTITIYCLVRSYRLAKDALG
jgi:hypothetical protein